MKRRKTTVLGCIALMIAILMTGCGSNSNAESNTNSSIQENIADTESSSTSEGATEESNVTQESSAIIVQVTEVTGNTVTANVGEISSQGMGGAPGGIGGGAPSGEAPSGEVPSGTGGSAPSGEAPSGEVPSGTGDSAPSGEAPSGDAPSGTGEGAPSGEAPSGDAPGGQPGQGRSSFTESGETVTFTLTDSTKITVEYLQGSGEGTAEDIVANAVLEVTLDADNNATEIIVKNLNAGNGFGGSSEVTNGTAANTIEEDTSINGTSYTSSGDDENALRVDGATVTLDGITVDKTGGESSNTENGDFYGQNAALLALNGATVTITNANVNTHAVNGNAVFSYGEGTTVNISDSTIRTTQNNSGGIQTTGGGTTNATNLDVETQGNSAAAIRSDRGGGTVNVDGGTYVTNGTGSPSIYCTADISVANATLTANASEGVVVEGKNSVSLTDCDLTSKMSNTYNGDSDENIHCIMIYQSMSGDAAVGEAYFSAEGGTITSLSGDMFYVTNTDCEINLRQVAFTLANDTFLRVEGNSSSRGWGTEGANGGDVILTAAEQTIKGNILVDSISTLKLTMQEGTNFTGAINPDGDGGTVDVILDDTSSWTLTKDSYITSFDGDTANVDTNGYHLYVAGEEVK